MRGMNKRRKALNLPLADIRLSNREAKIFEKNKLISKRMDERSAKVRKSTSRLNSQKPNR